MIEIVDVPEGPSLDDYAAYAFLSHGVEALVSDARRARERLSGRTVWMVSSTREGGGVAEGLPRLVSLLRQLGVATEWAVIGSDRPEFFALTKRIHNLLHGSGDPALGDGERGLFDGVGHDLAAELRPHLRPDDVLVIHDPQPLAAGAALKRDLGLPLVWRCHVGLEERNAAVDAAWAFLEPYACGADRAAFSLPDYVPPFLDQRATILPPSTR